MANLPKDISEIVENIMLEDYLKNAETNQVEQYKTAVKQIIDTNTIEQLIEFLTTFKEYSVNTYHSNTNYGKKEIEKTEKKYDEIIAKLQRLTKGPAGMSNG